MGYTTKFSGHFELSRPLTFAEAREWLSTINEAGSPKGYLQWVPTEDLQGVIWDGHEKFYDYTAWLRWLIDKWLKPWGIVLYGSVQWSGEDVGDTGVIEVNDNVVSVFKSERKPRTPKNPLTLDDLKRMALDALVKEKALP